MRLIIIAFAVVFGGCALIPGKTTYTPPVSTAFSVVKVLAPPSITIMPLGKLPAVKKVVINGHAYAAFTTANFNKLSNWAELAKKNTKIASSLSGTLNAVIGERNYVRSLGLTEQSRANYMSKQWANAEQTIDEQRRINMWNNIWHNLLIIGIIVILH